MRNFLATLSPYTHAPNVAFPVCVRVGSRANSCVNLSSYNTCVLPVKVEFWEIIPPVKTRNKFRTKLVHPTLSSPHSCMYEGLQGYTEWCLCV